MAQSWSTTNKLLAENRKGGKKSDRSGGREVCTEKANLICQRNKGALKWEKGDPLLY